MVDFIEETRFYKQLECFRINVCYLLFYSSLTALILHSWVLLSYKLFSYLIHCINLEWH